MNIVKKVLPYIVAVLTLVIGVLVFLFVDIEGMLWHIQKEAPVNSEDIVSADSDDWLGDVSGREAGEGILHLTSAEQWEELGWEYVTVVPVQVYKTNVYSLAEWTTASRRSRSGTYKGSKDSAKEMPFDYLWGYAPYFAMEYNPYYIIELEDGTHILTMMSRSAANRASRGESIPLGTKEYFGSTQAKSLLKDICDSMDVSAEYYLCAIDEEWMEKNASFIFWGKAVCAVAVMAIILVLESVVRKRMEKKKDGAK